MIKFGSMKDTQLLALWSSKEPVGSQYRERAITSADSGKSEQKGDACQLTQLRLLEALLLSSEWNSSGIYCLERHSPSTAEPRIPPMSEGPYQGSADTGPRGSLLCSSHSLVLQKH